MTTITILSGATIAAGLAVVVLSFLEASKRSRQLDEIRGLLTERKEIVKTLQRELDDLAGTHTIGRTATMHAIGGAAIQTWVWRGSRQMALFQEDVVAARMRSPALRKNWQIRGLGTPASGRLERSLRGASYPWSDWLADEEAPIN